MKSLVTAIICLTFVALCSVAEARVKGEAVKACDSVKACAPTACEPAETATKKIRVKKVVRSVETATEVVKADKADVAKSAEVRVKVRVNREPVRNALKAATEVVVKNKDVDVVIKTRCRKCR